LVVLPLSGPDTVPLPVPLALPVLGALLCGSVVRDVPAVPAGSEPVVLAVPDAAPVSPPEPATPDVDPALSELISGAAIAPSSVAAASVSDWLVPLSGELLQAASRASAGRLKIDKRFMTNLHLQCVQGRR
jgi:hypothetical protein